MAKALFSRQDLGRLAGVDDKVAAYWLTRGLIRSEVDHSAGRRHRRFSRDSVKIAAILRGAWLAGLNIEALGNVAVILNAASDNYRAVIQSMLYFDVAPTYYESLFYSYNVEEIIDNVNVLDDSWHSRDLNINKLNRLEAEISDIKHDIVRAYHLACQIGYKSVKLGNSIFGRSPDETLFAWRGTEGEWCLDFFVVSDDGRILVDTEFLIALNLKRLLLIEFDD